MKLKNISDLELIKIKVFIDHMSKRLQKEQNKRFSKTSYSLENLEEELENQSFQKKKRKKINELIKLWHEKS
jgi:hypothetical protein